jgi:hypothetical protein
MQATVPRQTVGNKAQPVLVPQFRRNQDKRFLQVGLLALIKTSGGNLREFGK